MKRRQKMSTKIKRKVSKATGIPVTKSGRKAKVRRGYAKAASCGLVALSVLTFSAIAFTAIIMCLV